MFFDRRGHRVSRHTWLLLSAKLGYTSIADDTATDRNGSCHDVQTFWIGVGDRHHRLIFCTVVTHDQGTPAIWGWQTEHAAREGHRAIYAWISEHTAEPAGRRQWSP